MTVKEEIREIIVSTLDSKVDFNIEVPPQKELGDYSTNVALKLSKGPMKEAEFLKAKLLKSKIFKDIQVVKPGFINFFLSTDYLQKKIAEILREKEEYGKVDIGKKEKVNVEFISANPTGPLTLGNARGGFCGDVLAAILEKADFEVTREYYVNDIGSQVEKKLKLSLEGKEGGYTGQHIDELRKKGVKDPKKAAKIILDEHIKPTIKNMGIEFDSFVFESSLEKEREEVEKILSQKGLLEEKEGTLWFKSKEFGDDDKNRVLRKKDGKQTYILSDMAYLKDKFERGFDKLIYFLGAEHHGYVARLKAGAEALGYKKEQVEVVLMQLVKLLKDGKEVRMSKRKGIYITIDDVLKEIDVDVARYFFLMRSPGNHLLFDLDLAKEQSEKNPVYYIQYAHARIFSILRKAGEQAGGDLKLTDPSELGLAKELIRFPEVVADAATDYQVQSFPQYARELAESFHRFYTKCRVLTDDKELESARISLVLATKIVLRNTLDLMGISAPEKM